MAGASITIDYQFNDQRIVEALRRMERAGANMEPAFIDIGEGLLNSHRARWAQQISPDGQTWEPLSEKYRARKKKNADKILVLEGFMRDTLAYNTSRTGLELGTNRIQGATQQFGDPERGIPAREFLGLSPEDEQMVIDTLLDHYELAVTG